FESVANRRPPWRPFSNAMSTAGPCGWNTSVPPVSVNAVVGLPRVRCRTAFWSKTRMSGVNGFGLPGNIVWNFASSLQMLGNPWPDSSTNTSNPLPNFRKARPVGQFSPDTKTETLKPFGTTMSWPWPGSNKTVSVGHSGFATVAAPAGLGNIETTTPPAQHPRSLAFVFDKAEHLRTLTSLAVAQTLWAGWYLALRLQRHDRREA